MTTDNICFYLQNRLIQTSQTGGQRYSDTSPLSVPWLQYLTDPFLLAASQLILHDCFDATPYDWFFYFSGASSILITVFYRV
jgi:hypothetical protein